MQGGTEEVARRHRGGSKEAQRRLQAGAAAGRRDSDSDSSRGRNRLSDVASTPQGPRVEEEQDRRQIACLMFLYKCVHSLIDSLYMVGAIQFHCQSRCLLRPNIHFRISNSRLNIRKYSVLNR